MKKERIKNTKTKVQNFWGDFKKFISRGNMLDLAIAVVIGGAFSRIVTSLVNDLIMPLVSLATGGTSVSDLKWIIKEAVYDINGIVVTAETAFRYGAFIQAIIDFLIISFFIFIAFKIINASTKKLERLKEEIILKIQSPDSTKQQIGDNAKKVLTDAVRQELLLTEIRDLLKDNLSQTQNSSKKKKTDE